MRYACMLIAIALVGCSSKPDSKAMEEKIAASMEALKNPRIYEKLDSATLREIPNTDLELAVFDYAASKLDGKNDRQILMGLSPGVRALYLTWVVEAEVNNGGFNQYYFNTEGAFAPDAVDAFEFFGATQLAALMREANAVREAEEKAMAKFKDAKTLEAFLESYEETKLGPLDDRFIELSEKLTELRVARIRQTPELFEGQ